MPFTKAELLSCKSRKPILDRLMSKSFFNEYGCQIYTGSLDRSGYGVFKVGKRNLGAHKVMYIMTVGDFDQDKYEMLHSCHNPACINPKHLSVGTHKENIYQTIERGTFFGGKRKIPKRLCAESDTVCLIFNSTYEAELLGYKSANVCTSMKRGGKFRGFKWRYLPD